MNSTPIVRTAGRRSLLVTLVLAGALVFGCANESDPWQTAGARAVQEAWALAPKPGPARNVILFVGDGMGISTVTAARILEGQLRGEPGEENLLSFERLPWLALAKTYNTNQQVSDSAGTMTAMVTGSKTRAGVLSVQPDVSVGDAAEALDRRLETLCEQAEQRGLATGIVSTARITHATPAACYAHSPSRDWEDDSELSDGARALAYPDIARQLVEFPFGDGLDLALGGGRRHFLPRSARDPEYPERTGQRRDRRDLASEWVAGRENAAYVWNREQLEALDPASVGPVLGLFEPSHMQWEADRSGDAAGEPSLSEMTSWAIDHLSRHSPGYLLIVEAGRIDHGHHANNAYRALTDTVELSAAVRTALAKVSLDDTLVIVTADHSHVFTMAGYSARGNDILGLVVHNDSRGDAPEAPALDALGLPYTTLGYQNGPGYHGASAEQPAGPKHFPHSARGVQGIVGGRADLGNVDTAAADYLQEAAVPRPSETHAGEDVPIYADGPGAHLFHGVREQSYVYHVIVEALGWTALPPVTSN